MTDHDKNSGLDRRGFFKTAGAGLSAAGLVLTGNEAGGRRRGAGRRVDREGQAGPHRVLHAAHPIDFQVARRGGKGAGAGRERWTRRRRVPGCAAPPRARRRPPRARRRRAGGAGAGIPTRTRDLTNAQMKEKYGEITMLDFPQFTKDTFPGVTRMDIFSGLFGDVTDDSMFRARGGGFDPLSPSGRKWLDKLAAKLVEDRHEGAAHLEQRAVEPARTVAGSRRAAQGRRRDGQALAGGLRGARRASRCA